MQNNETVVTKSELNYKRIVVVDNMSVHVPKLLALFQERLTSTELRICETTQLSEEDVAWADLVVFSGGTGRSIHKNPQTFNSLVERVVKSKTPLVGICLGAEAIGVYYGATLEDMGVRRVGNIPITLDKGKHNDIFGEPCKVMVNQFHRWVMRSVPPPLKTLATSKDGVEIFQHESLPIWGFQFHPEIRRRNNSGHILFFHALEQMAISL